MDKNGSGLFHQQLRFLGMGPMTGEVVIPALAMPDTAWAFDAQVDGDDIEVVLHCRRLPDYVCPCLVSYDLVWGGRRQRYFIYRGRGITLKEGYNLLAGRAVFRQWTNRREKAYWGWAELDFSREVDYGHPLIHYPGAHFFDLKAALELVPLASYSKQSRSWILRSLQRGSLVPVWLEGGMARLRAQPAWGTIEVIPLSSKGADDTAG